jgi:hypothetical protein
MCRRDEGIGSEARSSMEELGELVNPVASVFEE